MKQAYVALLASTSVFGELTQAELAGVAKLVVKKSYRARQLVLRKGDPAQQLFVIAKGRLKAVTGAADGRQAALSIMGPGEVFGEVALLDGEPRSASITAIEPCELLMIQRADFFHYLERHPRVALKLLEVLAKRLRRLSERVEDTQLLEVPGRLAKRLLRLATRYGVVEPSGTVVLTIKLSQRELGDLVGATRESVNKQLRVWIDEGWIERRGSKLAIIDRPALSRLAAGGAATSSRSQR